MTIDDRDFRVLQASLGDLDNLIYKKEELANALVLTSIFWFRAARAFLLNKSLFVEEELLQKVINKLEEKEE